LARLLRSVDVKPVDRRLGQDAGVLSGRAGAGDAVDATVVAIGEVGLAGEIRVVPQLDKRAQEAARMGFHRCIVPKPAAELEVSGIELVPVEHIAEALVHLIP